MHTEDAARHPSAYHTLVTRFRELRRAEAPGPIVVAVDGSARSQAAVRRAAELAKEDGSEVIAVHALPIIAQFVRDVPPLGLTPWRDDLKHRFTDEWCAPLVEARVPHRAVLVDRPVLIALVGVAAAKRASRILLGEAAEARPGGNLAAHLHDEAPCPVVVVSSAAEPGTAGSTGTAAAR